MIATPAQLEEYFTAARKHGVARLRVGEIEFVLGPAPSTAGVPDLPESITPRCPGGCPHPPWEHTATGCIHNCPPSMCIPAKAPTKGS